jgi:hypothetical protein
MAEDKFLIRISPAKVPEGCPARQVRFMSTQKRVYRSQHIRCTDRAGVGCIPLPAHIARYVCAAAKGRTAPLLSIFWSALAWAATKLLHSDHPTRQLVRPLLKADRNGSPPPRARSRAALGKQASPRSSLPHIPYPSGIVRIHRILPHAPAGDHRRAERYDGKRDMHFQHAA